MISNKFLKNIIMVFKSNSYSLQKNFMIIRNMDVFILT